MDTILVGGIDTVVGANLAATLSDTFRVVGAAFSFPVSIAGCKVTDCAEDDTDTIRHLFASVRPDWTVYCGAASESCWEADSRQLAGKLAGNGAQSWASAAREFDARLTYISSDAVFTGPWMFHEEESIALCPSDTARAIRATEKEVQEICPTALVTRTHAYGWLPGSADGCRIEQILNDLQTGTSEFADCVRHATPILSADLADLLSQAYRQRLQGVFHIAGAERVNPARFVRELADVFELPAPESKTIDALSEPSSGFARGETSLQTRKIRQALNVGIPTLADGISRLRQQQLDGYCDRFETPLTPAHEKVA